MKASNTLARVVLVFSFSTATLAAADSLVRVQCTGSADIAGSTIMARRSLTIDFANGLVVDDKGRRFSATITDTTISYQGNYKNTIDIQGGPAAVFNVTTTGTIDRNSGRLQHRERAIDTQDKTAPPTVTTLSATCKQVKSAL